MSRTAAHGRSGGRTTEYIPAFRTPIDRRTPNRVRQGRPSRTNRESTLDQFIQSGVVKPMTSRNYSRGQVA